MFLISPKKKKYYFFYDFIAYLDIYHRRIAWRMLKQHKTTAHLPRYHTVFDFDNFPRHLTKTLGFITYLAIRIYFSEWQFRLKWNEYMYVFGHSTIDLLIWNHRAWIFAVPATLIDAHSKDCLHQKACMLYHPIILSWMFWIIGSNILQTFLYQIQNDKNLTTHVTYVWTFLESYIIHLVMEQWNILTKF